MLFDVHITNKERKWNETTTQDASFLCNHTFVSLSHVNRQSQKQEKHKKMKKNRKCNAKRRSSIKKTEVNKENQIKRRKSQEKKNPTKIFSLA